MPQTSGQITKVVVDRLPPQMRTTKRLKDRRSDVIDRDEALGSALCGTRLARSAVSARIAKIQQPEHSKFHSYHSV